MQSEQTPLTHSFCQYVVRDDEPLVIDDARVDDRCGTTSRSPTSA